MLRSFGLTAVAIATISISLAVLATFVLVVYNLQRLTAELGDHVGLSAYLQEDAWSEGPSIVERVESWPEVKKAWVLTSSQALSDFRNELGPDSVMLEGLPDDVVPPSVELQLYEKRWAYAEVKGLAARVLRLGGVSDVRYGQQDIEQLSSVLVMVRTVTLILGLSLGLATLLVVYNTIRLTLYARRDEIEIMSLVGATPIFLRAPFVIEGVLQGFIGGILSMFIVSLLEDVLLQQLVDGLAYLKPSSVELISIPPLFGVLLVGLGALLGMLGSLVAMARFLQWR